MLSMLFACPGFAFRAGPTPHGSARLSAVRMAPPGAVKAAWPASQPRCFPKMEISEADQKEMTDMAEMCNDGSDYACKQLASEDAAKVAWLMTQPAGAPGTKVAAALGGGGGGGAPPPGMQQQQGMPPPEMQQGTAPPGMQQGMPPGGGMPPPGGFPGGGPGGGPGGMQLPPGVQAAGGPPGGGGMQQQ